MTITDKIMENALKFGMMKGKEGDKGNSGGGMGPEFIPILGGILDQMVKSVPLSDFKRIKAKDPKAKIVPILEVDEIEHEEAKIFLGLVSTFGDEIPKDLKKGVFKVAMGLAYRIDTDDKFRAKYNDLLNRITDHVIKSRIEKLKVDKLELVDNQP